MAHTCHAAGCSTRCANSMFMCRPHWRSLPQPMRDGWTRQDASGPGRNDGRDLCPTCQTDTPGGPT